MWTHRHDADAQHEHRAQADPERARIAEATVALVAYAGARVVYGFQGKVMGPLGGKP